MIGHGFLVGMLLQRDQFEIRPIGKTGDRHLRRAVDMSAAKFAGNADGSQTRLHFLQVLACNRNVIDVEIGGLERRDHQKE